MRRLLLTVTLILAVLALWSSSGTAGTGISDAAVPTADCGPGSKPETSIQGRIPAADYASGRYLQGYTCNTAAVAHEGSSGGFKTLRYTDAAGNTCAFYDSTALVPPTSTLTNLLGGKGVGVVVLDMNDPAHPVRTATLTSAAMLSPHESLLVNAERGLLVGVLGTFLTAPGALDVYDVKTDCRHPKLLSTSLAGILGHESGFAPDGKTLYVSSTIFTLIAVNLDDPRRPKPMTIQGNVQYHGMRVSDDGNTLYAAHIGQPSADFISGGGLRILDVSQVQARVPNPKVSILSTMTWNGSSIPQVPEPFTRDGHQYLFEVDEFTDLFSLSGLTDLRHAPVGAARIINVDDPRHPYLVSNVRLAVHEPDNHAGEQWSDPGGNNALGGYAAHYCSVTTRDNPNLAGCSMILSGLRIFDIRDVEHPKEVAYFQHADRQGWRRVLPARVGPGERQRLVHRLQHRFLERATHQRGPGPAALVGRNRGPSSGPAPVLRGSPVLGSRGRKALALSRIKCGKVLRHHESSFASNAVRVSGDRRSRCSGFGPASRC